MYTYVFEGKLEPENLITNFDLSSTISLQQRDFGIDGILDIVIKRASITVIYTSSIDHSLSASSNLETLENFVQDAVELVINLYGYVHSIYLDVYILNVKCEDLRIDYAFGIKGERNLSKSSSQALEEFNKLFSLFASVKNSSLKDVFSDFHKAIKYPAATGQFCFRAVEVIRTNYFEDPADKDEIRRRNNGWGDLRKKLGYRRQDFDEIMQYGVPNRHGIYPVITYPVRQRILNFTREVVDKFIQIKLGIS